MVGPQKNLFPPPVLLLLLDPGWLKIRIRAKYPGSATMPLALPGHPAPDPLLDDGGRLPLLEHAVLLPRPVCPGSSKLTTTVKEQGQLLGNHNSINCASASLSQNTLMQLNLFSRKYSIAAGVADL